MTLPRLKAFIASFGLVSPGRARALLSYMHHLGSLELDPAHAAKRPASFSLTGKFLASYRRHEASLLDAIRVVEPTVELLLSNLATSGVMDSLVIEQGDAFVVGNRQTATFAAWYRVFLHPLAGIQILHDLVARAKTFPPTGNLPFSPAETSRRFKVSRVHVARLMNEAEREGFVIVETGSLQFTDAGRDAIEWQYASRLCLHLGCAARTLKANPQVLTAPA
ncbi:MAG TPA: hypothetical protein VFE10_13840 [Phenylobacterium sp.]|nr:hypothetical protein [Phenylobacterium sp.]